MNRQEFVFPLYISGRAISVASIQRAVWLMASVRIMPAFHKEEQFNQQENQNTELQ